MFRVCAFALLGGMFILAGGLVGQEPKKDDAKKDEPAAKLKGKLPSHWGKIGLTDAQKQTIYSIQSKYDPEIEKLEAKIVELKATKDKEMKAVLTAEQKKALETAMLGGKDKDK
jgi:Spy/CpxP family protein refolding chaperone